MTSSPDELVTWFNGARALPPAERQEFLDRLSAGNPGIRGVIEAMLYATDLQDHPAETIPYDNELGPASSSSVSAGDTIGRYRIAETIGEGGMGIVYRAEDPEARRSVALKVIKPGMDTKQILARFDAEKNALSLMDHPNIARVYDSGQTAEGRPYFVLEYVAGTTLTEYCAQERLDLEARLRLFQQICEGVQHAHTKAVVHRDLKPANIIVTRVDDKPTPKIIDFGLAKALGARLTDLTMISLQRQVMGTLEYMSPEQAGSGGSDVDTRTDVYALGVILYELLVDRRPFDLRERTEDELFRIIREEDPPRPSLQLARLSAAESSQLADSRGLDTGRLRSRLQGELDWIVLKALEKQRDRRYPTALELSADVERFLGGSEPVVARPPSAIYKLRKFSRKYRAGLLTAGLVVCTLIVGITWALFERQRAETRAKEARDERARADENAAQAVAAKEAAEELTIDLLGLADTKRLTDARRNADRLWPLSIEMRGALQRWLVEEARPLMSNLPEHERVLDLLRATAHRSLEPEAATTDEGGGADPVYTFRLPTGAIDTETQWQHDTRAELVRELRRFTDPAARYGDGIGSVEWRVAELDRLEVESVTSAEAKARWQECIADIANDDEVYGNLVLEPQFGLLPLERNARTRLWEFAHLPTGARPQPNPKWRPSDEQQTDYENFNRWQLTAETGVVLVLVPAGTVRMGAVAPSLEVDYDDASLRVSAVPKESVGSSLELLPGDVVRRVQSVSVESAVDVSKAMASLRSADAVQVTVLRSGQEEQLATHLRPDNWDPEASLVESPSHNVALEAYFISKYELTQAQWQRITGENPSQFLPDFVYDHHENQWWNPVEKVSWVAAHQMLPRYGLLLPTEAQWEHAARAGTDTPWWCGATRESIGTFAAGNVSDAFSHNSPKGPDWKYDPWDDPWILHAPVGSFRANAFGLHDTIGNVWEWCRDDWDRHYAVLPNAGDGLRVKPDARHRPRRGASFKQTASSVRSSMRYHSFPEFSVDTLGVRPARLLD